KRKVEWCDAVDDAARRADHAAPFASAGCLYVDRNRLARESLGLSSSPRECRDRPFDLAAGVDHGLGGFEGDGSNELVLSGGHTLRYRSEACGDLKPGKRSHSLR